MAKVPVVTALQTVRAFEKVGFARRRQTGSHYIMKKPGHPYILSIPIHKGKTLPQGTLRGIIAAAGLTVEQFTNLL